MLNGHSKDGRTPTYNSWRKMMERCYNRNQIGFENFGGKGIAVEPEWHDFATLTLTIIMARITAAGVPEQYRLITTLVVGH